MEWIKKIVPTIGLLVGIIMFAIGSVMVLQSIGKLLFTEPNISFVESGCEYKYSPELSKEVKLEGEEQEKCIERRTEEEEHFFYDRFTTNLINGVSLLIVGGIFWLIFRREEKK